MTSKAVTSQRHANSLDREPSSIPADGWTEAVRGKLLSADRICTSLLFCLHTSILWMEAWSFPENFRIHFYIDSIYSVSRL